MRPEELVESNLYQDSNNGLKYKYCQLQVDQNGNLTMLITRRLMKKQRGMLDKS